MVKEFEATRTLNELELMIDGAADFATQQLVSEVMREAVAECGDDAVRDNSAVEDARVMLPDGGMRIDVKVTVEA